MVKILKFLLLLILSVVLLVVMVLFQVPQHLFAMATGSWGRLPGETALMDPAGNCGSQAACDSGPMRVLTFNILCRVCTESDRKPGYETWYVRLPYLREIIRYYDPDLIGFQETGGLRDLEELNPDPDRFGWLAYCEGGLLYGDAALLYRKDRFESLDKGQFWLNPNFRLPFGYGWKPLSMPRYVNWVRLRNRENGFEFLFVNTHFDNNSPNKEPSAVLVHEVMRTPALHLPIVMTGDFNTQGDTQRYQNLVRGNETEPLLKEAAELATVRQLVPPAFPDEPPVSAPPDLFMQQIDHIFLGGPGKWEVTRWAVDTRAGGAARDIKPSDHPAVFAEIRCILR